MSYVIRGLTRGKERVSFLCPCHDEFCDVLVMRGTNNRIDFMDLPSSGYGPRKVFLSSKPIRIKEGRVREIKSYINDRILKRPENAMRCSEMVEVVE